MRRITMAVLATVTLIVLLFSYPTSTNRVATASPVATATGVAATSSATPSGSATSSGTSSGSSGGTGGSGGPTGTTSSKSSTTSATSYTGTAADTQYGPVQVRITVAGGKITAAEAVEYPSGSGRDQEINAGAIPQLNASVLQHQSASIDMVSGATYTSDGYAQSLQSAIDQAKL